MTPKQLREVISKNVRDAREKANLNQSELAHLCGTRQATISRIENGISGVDDEILAKLGEALKVHPAALMMDAAGKSAEKPKHRSLKIGA